MATLACTQHAKSQTDIFHNPTLYRSIVGNLQYLTLITRPNVSYAVNQAAQRMHNPAVDNWGEVKRILHYLCGTSHHGLLLRGMKPLQLYGYSDVDQGSDLLDRKCTSGFVVYFGSDLVSWSSRKQRIVARSTTDAEYWALASLASEVTWVQSLLSELGYLVTTLQLWCDKILATYLTANPMFHARSKHLKIDFHFVRDKVVKRQFHVSYISTVDQLADIFTKPLSKARFLGFKNKLTVKVPPNQLEGG